MRISDWSSDVCSSDLKAASGAQFRHRRARKSGRNSVTIKARNASVAIIGAGDYIGAAIAKRFAREGFLVKVGRRGGDKLQPLLDEIEAAGERKSTRLNSSHSCAPRMQSSA